MIPNPISSSEPLIRPRTYWQKGRMVPQEEELCNTNSASIQNTNSPSPSPRELWHFNWATQGEREIKHFEDSCWHWYLEMWRVIWHPCLSWGMRGQVINGVLAKVQFTWTRPVVHFHRFWVCNWDWHTWELPHSLHWILGLCDWLMGEAK